MKKIADWFGIPLRDVVAFGDDVNDGNMIRLAGTGVAMGNAVESLKQTADDVADSNDNDGVAKWIAAHLAADG